MLTMFLYSELFTAVFAVLHFKDFGKLSLYLRNFGRLVVDRLMPNYFGNFGGFGMAGFFGFLTFFMFSDSFHD